jgi:kynurenine formamidase
MNAGIRIIVALLLTVGLMGMNEDTPKPGVRFMPVDIYIDSGDAALGAWQISFSGSPDVELVGVEGGEHPAYAEPAHYDAAALMHDRVILAALNTTDALPTGKTRVARLHLRVSGEPTFETTLIAAGDADGERIDATATAAPGVTR